MGNWISVKDRVPDEREILDAWHSVRGRQADVYIYYYDKEKRLGHWQHKFSSMFAGNEKITHWMPIPERPLEDDNGSSNN